jgi:hypothetical protein
MAAVNFTQGLKMVGDRASGVAGAAAAIAGMSFDDNTNAFANTHTACSTPGASPHFQGNPLDATPVGPVAATPYVVPHLCTLTAGQFNTFVVKRIAVHNSAAPTDASTTLMFGIDGLSITKASTFALTPTFKLAYS